MPASNQSGWSPAGATIEFLTSRGMTTMPQTGIHSVTVPGAVAGWMALHEKFGHDSFDTILSAAIAQAEQGFPCLINPAAWTRTEKMPGFLSRQAPISGTCIPTCDVWFRLSVLGSRNRARVDSGDRLV